MNAETIPMAGSCPAGSWIFAGQEAWPARFIRSPRSLPGLLSAASFLTFRITPRRSANCVWVPGRHRLHRLSLHPDQTGVPYVIRDEDIRGNLREHLDVLLYGTSIRIGSRSKAAKRWAMPFKENGARLPASVPGESDDITGGIGYAGLAEVQRFLEAADCS